MAGVRAAIGTGGLAETGADRIESTMPVRGVELLRARLTGRAYETHRHDTYAICVTDFGRQVFDYRGATWTSGPGRVVVLHPDEAHDGRAGTDAAFGYRIVYVAPGLVAEAARPLCHAGAALPFVREPVLANTTLARAVGEVFEDFPAAPEPLAVDALVEGLTRGLLEANPPVRITRPRRGGDGPALERVRQFLDAERRRVVSSEELEAVGGQDRFALARQFRRAYGTSPYRYLLMRRLDLARAEIGAGKALAEVALDAGFADQPHLSRQFKAAYGLSPAQFRAAIRTR